METRALSIAFFYAAGTAAGGIAGPLLFGHLIATGRQDQVAIGFFIGAGVMAIGGIAELLFGVKAEQEGLEKIAKPLTAEEAEEGGEEEEEEAKGGEDERPGERRKERPSPPEGRPYRRRPSSPGMPAFGPYVEPGVEHEVEAIERALREHGEATRRELARRVGARYWGPGRFRMALRQAGRERRVKLLGRGHYASA